MYGGGVEASRPRHWFRLPPWPPAPLVRRARSSDAKAAAPRPHRIRRSVSNSGSTRSRIAPAFEASFA